MLRPLPPLAGTCLLAALVTGCGYIGEPLPPALRRPVPVTDLTAVEHGSKIAIQFTVPKVTTEDLQVAGSPDIELRIGARPDGSQPDTWAGTADRITDIRQEKGLAKVEVDVAKYSGQAIAVGVNVRGPGGRTAGWSNFIAVNVVPALAKPDAFEAKDGPDQVLLGWHAIAPEFRIFRKTVAAADWTRIGTATKPEYADSTIEYGQTYEYFVQAQQKAGDGYAESEASEVTTIKPVDRFAPSSPAGLTVAPGTRTMELVWDRNTEKDFASYRIYRNGQLLPQTVTSPAFSDSDVQPGMKYEYQISALDTAGNESAKCTPVSGEIP
jgi:fibronectin type 3 domain-containing protein